MLRWSVPILAATALSFGASLAPASAATVMACPASFTTTPGFVACKYVGGNVLNNANVATQQQAINSLLGTTNYTVNWSTVDPTKGFFSHAADATTTSTKDGILTSTQPMFGKTILGIRFGNSNPSIGNATAFLLFDFAATTSTVKFDVSKGYSTAALYQTQVIPQTPVPEPATWALLILGFGMVGAAMRRSRTALRPELAG